MVGFLGGALPFVKPYILYGYLQDDDIAKYFYVLSLAAILYPISTLGFSEYSTIIRAKFNRYWNKNKESFLIVEFVTMQIPALIFCVIAYLSLWLNLYDVICLYIFFICQSIYLSILRHNRLKSGTSVYRYIATKSFIEICLIILALMTRTLTYNITILIEISSIILSSQAFCSLSRSNTTTPKFKFSSKTLRAMTKASLGNLKYNVLSSVLLNGDRLLFKNIFAPELYVKYLFVAMLKNSFLSFFSLINNYLYSYFVEFLKNNKIQSIKFKKTVAISYVVSIIISLLIELIWKYILLFLPEKYSFTNKFPTIFLVVLYSLIYSNQFLEWYFLFNRKFDEILKANMLNIASLVSMLCISMFVYSLDINIAIFILTMAVLCQQMYLFVQFTSNCVWCKRV